MVGYLTVYDRSLLTLLYDPRIKPGMTARQVRAVLPRSSPTKAWQRESLEIGQRDCPNLP